MSVFLSMQRLFCVFRPLSVRQELEVPLQSPSNACTAAAAAFHSHFTDQKLELLKFTLGKILAAIKDECSTSYRPHREDCMDAHSLMASTGRPKKNDTTEKRLQP